MIFFSDEYLRHRHNKGCRQRVDANFIQRARRNGHRGNIVDLTGPGVLRRFHQWSSLRRNNHIHVAIEKDRSTWIHMNDDAAAIRAAYTSRCNCPLKVEYGDFWDEIDLSPRKFRFVLFCHTHTLKSLIRDEKLLENLRWLGGSGKVNTPFYLMITACQRPEPPESRSANLKLVSKALQTQGWKEEERWLEEYGAPRNGQTHMLSCLFLFQK